MLMRITLPTLALLLLSTTSALPAAEPKQPPNFLIILCDNLGYGDVGCFGSKLHRTPNVDRLAKEGMKLTDFYVSSGVCTPSRASLMTGCYPRRVNMHVDARGGVVLRPVSPKGLHPNEITLAEVLKTKGYATALIGKWHLGDQPRFLPTRQGFDYYFGIPYSDDMTPREGKPWPPLPLMKNEKVIEAPVDRNLLTKRYTEQVIDFMKASSEKPFFIVLAHAMPGSTRAPFASKDFLGKSKNGRWGDSVEEIDWSTGEIVDYLKQSKRDRNTLVIWTSDNGAPRRNPPQGLNTPLSGWGYSTDEGGMRVPCVAWWPGTIPAGKVCSEVCTSMDFLPTFAKLADAKVPSDRIIDGKDVWPLLAGKPNAKSPHQAFFYYQLGQLQAVRSGKWKLYLPLKAKIQPGRQRPESATRLYDLRADLGEKNNVVKQHPDVAKRLMQFAENARQDLGDEKRAGKNQRPAGREEKPTPRVPDK